MRAPLAAAALGFLALYPLPAHAIISCDSIGLVFLRSFDDVRECLEIANRQLQVDRQEINLLGNEILILKGHLCLVASDAKLHSGSTVDQALIDDMCADLKARNNAKKRVKPAQK